MAITEGKAPPAFTLNDTDGNKVSLAQFKGQEVVVYFYPKDDTPGCTKEACGFRDLWGEYQAAGLVVLGVLTCFRGQPHRSRQIQLVRPF